MIAAAAFNLVKHLRNASVREKMSGSVRLGAVGATIFAIGWLFYIVAVRDESWARITGAVFGAATAVAYALALWLTFSRMRTSAVRA